MHTRVNQSCHADKTAVPFPPCSTESLVKSGKVPDVTIVDAQKNYKKALQKGVLKILSKVRVCSSLCATMPVQIFSRAFYPS